MRVAADFYLLSKGDDDLSKHYETAAKAGFKLVETANPYCEAALKIREMLDKFGLEQAQINTPGTYDKGRGFACLPDKKSEFVSSLKTSLEYAKVLKCPVIQIMAGIPCGNFLAVQYEQSYVQNLKYASELAAEQGIITVVIEPNSGKGNTKGYFLNSFDQALGYVEEIHAPNLKIQLDFFHAQGMCGNITGLVKKLKEHIGYVQVAQFPNRHEPDSQGELNFEYIFDLLRSVGYDGVIGGEYIPTKEAELRPEWVEKYGLSF